MSNPKFHPLDALNGVDISSASALVKQRYGSVPLRFKDAEVVEPPKAELIPFLEAERKGLDGSALPAAPPRIISLTFHPQDTKVFAEAIVNVDSKEILSIKQLGDIQGPIDMDEYKDVEMACLKHPTVLAEVEKMKLPTGTKIICEPWIYGTDDANEKRRLVQCYMYVATSDHPESNFYSLPCTFAPVFDLQSLECVRIDHLPTGKDHSTQEVQPWKAVEPVEYAEDLIKEPIRSDLKPLIVTQPKGASFTVEGERIKWQKWDFRLSYNWREGPVLNNILYDNRSTFHRISLSEMTVPYADPRAPYHRKQAFDLGDFGIGLTANELTLGCDCLGHIKYLDAFRVNAHGEPVKMQNVMCIHEQDAGIGWKHTNHRNGIATVVRNRQLVIQTICTLANYEYIVAYIFDQAGSIHMELRATGILSTTPIVPGLDNPWSTTVAPGVAAPYHQHIFCLRIDPAIDGRQNTVVYEDSLPMPVDDMNPYKVGYMTKQTRISHSQGFSDSLESGRVVKIENPNIRNTISMHPVSYKLHAHRSQMLLMHPDSINTQRAGFATKPFWVTKFSEGELYAAGRWTNQSHASTGVDEWVKRNDSTENEDIVLWHTFGLTHNPRPEDFPVMPAEIITVSLKPSSFFNLNPANDVARSSQQQNKSVLHEDRSVIVVNGNGRANAECCS
ncbi:hypothetical protein BT63DRAFT_475624 [Microthyrium microscopicum]|uniref:Amine oxidase n=1 Tax=Microthyrium microscopicum TaxID=703497 RepID=A0A6A6ULE3_9PEZI|nr:hypothetical protein BT63DRAFT_475624 [Microthyrium microscopicum]